MVLGTLSVQGRPDDLDNSRDGPTALAVGAGLGCLVFFLSSIISLLSPYLREMALYRLKYCLKGLLSPKQPTNQPTNDNNTRINIYDSLLLVVCEITRPSPVQDSSPVGTLPSHIKPKHKTLTFC